MCCRSHPLPTPRFPGSRLSLYWGQCHRHCSVYSARHCRLLVYHNGPFSLGASGPWCVRSEFRVYDKERRVVSCEAISRAGVRGADAGGTAGYSMHRELLFTVFLGSQIPGKGMPE